MQKIIPFYPCSPANDNPNPDFTSMLRETLIEPISKMGCFFLGTISLNQDETDSGVHILHFNTSNPWSQTLTDFLNRLDDLNEEGLTYCYSMNYDLLQITIHYMN